jgi:DNA-binding SARP family transcriptional activator
MEFRILGPLEVIDGERVVPLPRRKHRALLALLLLHAREVVSGDRLLEDLWGGRPPPTAKDALQNYVSHLRSSLGADIIVTRAPGYLLDVGAEQIDVGRFEALVARASAASDDAARAATLREALALWRGLPLADLIEEPFTLVEQPVLLDRRLTAYEDLIDAELALGRHARVLGEIEALVKEHPYDERLSAQLLLALYRVGRPADALEAFAGARQALDELGLVPGPELRALQRDILNHDPALLLPRRAPSARAPTRKTVTVLFAGLREAPALDGDVDPERVRLLADRVFGETSAAVERHGGRAERLADGSTMAVFGVPEAHEDDALRAVRAAVEIRESLLALRLEARLGLSTGEVLVADPAEGGTLVAGTPVSVARQLEQAAPAAEILLGAQTLRLVRTAVSAEPLAEAGRMPVFRLLRLVAGAPAFERHLDAPLVGRQRELADLRRAFDEVQAGRCCRVVTILGEAGIGKTRLADALREDVRDSALVLLGRCLSYGETATYLPLRDAVEQAGSDLTTVLGGAGSTGEEHLNIRRYLELLAAARPVVLVLEDVHWAGPSLLDLVEYLGEHSAGAPILVLCLARPELLEARPGWAASLTLAPLPDEQIVTLLAQLAGDAEPRLGSRIAELAEGNPLYAEQLLAYVGEGGSLESVPPTVEALLASRLDRLDPGERAVLQRAAVIGREFTQEAVTALAAREAAAVGGDLAALIRKKLVLRAGRESLRFQHALIRDVAYASLPKAERAELHERLADRLESDPAGSDELVGYHLEHAFRYASELGTADGRGRRLAADAGKRLGAAGLGAWKRGDTPAAANLLGRATALLPEPDPFRLALLCELGVALRGGGELHEAEAVLADAAETAAVAGDRRSELRARLELANVRLLRDPGGRAGELLAAARAAIPVLEALDDDRSLSRAWRLVAYVEGAMSCRYAASVEAAERALDHCRRSGWSTAACLGDLTAALYHGPTPAREGVRRCRALLKGADVGGEANVLVHLGGLEAMHGRFDEARRLVERSQGLYEDIGQSALAHANCGGIRGQIELLAGETAAAEQALRDSYDALESIGDRAYLATRAAQLADAVYAGGRHDEAERWTRIAKDGGSADDVPTQILWRGVRAKLLALAGEPAEAQALAEEALRLAAATDALNQRANVALDLAEVLRLAGRKEDAATAAGQALELFDQKGNTAAAARVRSLIAS